MYVANTAGVASFVVQIDVEDGEGAVDCVHAFNQVFAAVGEMYGIERPCCDVHGLRDGRAAERYAPSQYLGHISSSVHDQWRC